MVEDAVTRVPAKSNPYMSLALLGYYLNENYYPPYLKQKNFNTLKKRVDRIEIKTDYIQNGLADIKPNSIDKINLSNVLDWLDMNDFKQVLKELVRIGKHKSRFCYLNTLMKRGIPNNIDGIKSYKKTATELLKQDRAFLYMNFEIGEIIKK